MLNTHKLNTGDAIGYFSTSAASALRPDQSEQCLSRTDRRGHRQQRVTSGTDRSISCRHSNRSCRCSTRNICRIPRIETNLMVLLNDSLILHGMMLRKMRNVGHVFSWRIDLHQSRAGFTQVRDQVVQSGDFDDAPLRTTGPIQSIRSIILKTAVSGDCRRLLGRTRVRPSTAKGTVGGDALSLTETDRPRPPTVTSTIVERVTLNTPAQQTCWPVGTCHRRVQETFLGWSLIRQWFNCNTTERSASICSLPSRASAYLLTTNYSQVTPFYAIQQSLSAFLQTSGFVEMLKNSVVVEKPRDIPPHAFKK